MTHRVELMSVSDPEMFASAIDWTDDGILHLCLFTNGDAHLNAPTQIVVRESDDPVEWLQQWGQAFLDAAETLAMQKGGDEP